MRITIPWSERREGHLDIWELEIEPANTALLVVDVQRGYVEPSAGVGPTLQGHPDIFNYYYPRLSDVVLPNIMRLIDFFREHHLEVVFTRHGFMTQDARDLPVWNWRHGQVGTREARVFWVESPEAELMPELAQPDDLIVDKSSSGPFATSGLDQYLRNLNVENVVIAGVLTNVAVETAARDAGDRGYNAIAVEDASAAYWQDEHDETMASASWWVAKSTDSVIQELASGLTR